MNEKIKCCEDCIILHKAYEILNKEKEEDFIDTDRKRKALIFLINKLQRCPKKCHMWLKASNCTLNEDGTVNVNNSGRRY